MFIHLLFKFLAFLLIAGIYKLKYRDAAIVGRALGASCDAIICTC